VADTVRDGAGGSTPWRLTPASGFATVVRSLREFSEDRIPAAAASITFFVLLALFPGLSAFVSLYGLFADVEDARRQVAALAGVLPQGAVIVLSEHLTRLAAIDHGRLGLAFAASLILSLWSANAGMKALISGLNIAYEVKETRGFLRLNLVSLGFTAGAIVLAAVCIALFVAAPIALARVGLADLQSLRLMRWPLLLAVAAGLFSLLYRFAPAHPNARWRWITPGGLVAAGAWLGMSALFSWYVARFGRYDLTYGSLGAIVGFLTWIWLSLMVVLFGAELNAEIERRAEAPAGLA
jgi:membrane protein